MITLSNCTTEATLFIEYVQKERRLSPHTIRAYRSDLKQFLQFWNKVSDFDKEIHLGFKEIIDRFLISLFYKKISNNSIARKFSCFTAFIDFLKQKDLTCSIQLKRPRIEKKMPQYINQKNIVQLLETMNKSAYISTNPLRDTAIIELLYATGVRCSELNTIRIQDINFNDKTIKIFGKGKKERIVLFGSKAIEKLHLYINQERKKIENSTEFLFLNRYNEKISCRSIQRIINQFKLLLPSQQKISPHKIRHSFATHLLQRGVDLRIIQELLGHTNLTTTEKYTHISVDELKEICNTIHPLTKKE